MRLSITDWILEALGWTGIVFMILVVVGVIGTIVVSLVFYWEFGIRFLLFGIGVTLAFGFLVIAVSEFFRTSSSKVVKCPYCGALNKADATFCLKCDNVLPKEKLRLPHAKLPEKV